MQSRCIFIIKVIMGVTLSVPPAAGHGQVEKTSLQTVGLCAGALNTQKHAGNLAGASYTSTKETFKTQKHKAE